MKKLSILFLCSLIYSQVPAQLKEIFYDDFSSNKNQWSLGQDEGLYAKVETGKYIIDNGFRFTHRIAVGIDSTKDFSISITTTAISSKYDQENVTGLVFCSNLIREYQFLVTTKGKWYFVAVKIGLRKDELIVINSGTSKFIRQGFNASNSLKVERIDKTWHFYINDSSVNKSAGGKYLGHFAGFICAQDMKAEFDDFKISGTSPEPAENLCAVYLSFMKARWMDLII